MKPIICCADKDDKMLDELEGNRRMANQIAAKVFGLSELNQASLPVGLQVRINCHV